MSKQANQKYKKEKEKEHLSRAGIDFSAPRSDKDKLIDDKLHIEYNSPSNRADQ